MIYPHMFYNVKNFTIKVFTDQADYENQVIDKNTIYFLGNDDLKNTYDWKSITGLNVTDYNTLSGYDFKYKKDNLIFIK